jgi:hypothetical protein
MGSGIVTVRLAAPHCVTDVRHESNGLGVPTVLRPSYWTQVLGCAGCGLVSGLLHFASVLLCFSCTCMYVITFYSPEAVIMTSQDFAPLRGVMHQSIVALSHSIHRRSQQLLLLLLCLVFDQVISQL